MSEDYSFMKSGVNITNPMEDVNNTMCVITAFMEKALENASIYIKHSGRNMITTEDIKRCLILEVFIFAKRPDILEKVKEIKEYLYDYSEDEEDLSELIKEDFNAPEMKFKESEHDCGLCKCLNKIYDRWDNFIPSSQIEAILQKHINNIDTETKTEVKME